MKRTILLFSLCAILSPANAESGAAFLKIGAGARSLAMANAYTAAGGDVESVFFNPASLSALDQSQLSLTHAEWIDDTVFDAIAVGHPTRYGTWGISAIRLGGGTLEGRNALRQKTGDFSADDLGLGVSWGKSIRDQLGVGATARYLHSRIADVQATAWSFDGGILARVPGRPLWLGASVLNMGTQPRFIDQQDRLPLVLAVGLAARPVRPLVVTIDYKQEPHDDRSHLDLGSELSISYFAFRLGFTAPLNGKGDRKLAQAENLRGGFGVRLGRYEADYALAPFGDLGLTQRLTLSLRFGPDSDRQLNLRSLSRAPRPIDSWITDVSSVPLSPEDPLLLRI